MDPASRSLLVLAAVIVLFVWNKLPPGVVALLAALALYFIGVLGADAALAGFGDPVIAFIASLFVIGEGIDASGLTSWAGQRLIARSGGGTRLLAALLGLCALLAAVITQNGALAALIPMAALVAVRTGGYPSRILMPLAYVGAAGSLLTLIGSPVNVIVSEAAEASGGHGFGFFEFAVMGGPLAIATIATALLLGRRLLPARTSAEAPPDLSRYADTLAEHYALDHGFYRLRVRPQSPLVGRAVADIALEAYPGVAISARQPAGPDGSAIGPDDVLVVSGPSQQVSHLAVDQALAVSMRPVTDAAGTLITNEVGVAEVVVPPRSALIGEVVQPGLRRASDLVVLAVRRLGRDLGTGPTELTEGDCVLVHGAWSAIDALTADRQVFLVDSPDVIRRQVAPLGAPAARALVALAVMVVPLVAGLTPPAIAGVAGALAMVLLRVVRPPAALRAISWSTILLIGGLIPLSVAIKESGAAERIASVLVDIVGAGRPRLLMVGLFLLTAVLGQVVSNTATVLILAPVAVTAATDTGVSVRPILMVLAVAGAASFLTPVATPSNMMVMGPGGYRFGDYWKFGLPVMAIWFALAMIVIPLVWPF